MIAGGYTATGPRSANEDNFYHCVFKELQTSVGAVSSFVLVSDGMGGYQCGDVASAIVVETAKSYLSKILEADQNEVLEWNPAQALVEISLSANEAILAEARARGGIGMGATIVAAFASTTHAWIGHVGDSRAYLVHDGGARQLTEDHSKVGRMLSHGIISEEEAQTHPERNCIERALGFGDATPDLLEIDFEHGDTIVLCSDGVYTTVDCGRLYHYVTSGGDASSSAELVVRQALRRGTDDNSTAVLLMNKDESEITQRHATMIMPWGRNMGSVTDDTAEMPVQKKAMPRRTILAIVAGGVVLVGLIALLLFVVLKPKPAANQQAMSPAREESTSTVGSQQSTRESTYGSSHTSSSASSHTSSSTSSTTSSSTSSNSGVVESGSSTFVLGGEEVLEYVDQQGVAQRFSDDPFYAGEDAILQAGASVTKSSNVADSLQSKPYFVLSDTYLQDLKSDVELFRGGETTFSSSLAQACEPNSYAALVASVADVKPDMFDNTIVALVFEADASGTEPESSAQEPSEYGSENTSSEVSENVFEPQEDVASRGE